MTDLLSVLPIRGFTFYRFAIRYSPFAIRLFACSLILLWFLLHFSPLAHAAPPPQADDPAAQCAEGIKLFKNGQYAQAKPLLEAGFANRAKGKFPSPDDEGLCADFLGRFRDDTGDPSGALTAYEVALKIFKTSGNQFLEGTILNNIGLVYHHQGRYTEALETYQQALTILREVGNRAWESATLNNIGEVYRSQGRYTEALDAYQQALTISREVGDRAGEGTNLNNIGLVYHHQGRYTEALDAYQQALTISREVDDRAGEGITLANIGGVYYSQGRYTEVLETYQQVLTIVREVGDRVGEGTTLNNIGEVYRSQGRYAQALETYQQALTIRRQVGDRAGEGATLNNIGAVYTGQGRYAEALETYQQALTIIRQVGDRAGEGAILNNIGGVYDHQGRYARALETYQQALTIRRQVGDRAGESATLNNIGKVYRSQGRYVEALEAYQQALTIVREVGDRVGEGIILTNIGEVYSNQGRYAEALETYQQALTISREVGDRAGEGTILNGIGAVYDSQGKYAEALETYQQALTIIRQVGDRAGEGTILNGIGGVYYSQGRYTEALETYKQALTIQREVGNRAWEGTTLTNIGGVYNHQGRYAEALENYQQAIQMVEEIRATAGSEAARTSFAAQQIPLYDRVVALFHQQGQDEQAFLTAERGRARTFLDGLSTGQVQLSDNAAAELLTTEQEAFVEHQAAQDALAKVKAANPPDPKLVADLEQQLRETEKAYTDAQDAITARGDELADLIPGRNKNVLNVAQLQQLLDPQTTLLAYYLLDDKTLAFVLTAKNFQVIELPVTRTDLTDQVTKFRKFAENKTGDTTRMQAQKLYQTLLAPLAASLTTPRLVIVPHQVLHYLPFAALYDEQARQYLLEKYTLTMLPSASVLQYVTAKKQQGSSGAGEQGGDVAHTLALVIGNPTTGDFDVTASLATERGSLGELRFAEKEAKAIAVLYGVEPLLGKAATEAAVRQQVAGTGILHLAAHGYYNPVAPLSSLIALAPGDNYDGWLTVGEVYGLNLKQTELVVLSACQTQLGQLSSGDDLVGLTRAFIFAGTPTVVATLWNVDDEATKILMTQFYTHLQEGLGKAEALRQAQVDLIQSEDGKYADPFFWAAFVLSGDGGDPAATTSLVSAKAEATASQPISAQGVIGTGLIFCAVGILCLTGLLFISGGIWWLRWRKTIALPPSLPGE